MYFSQTLEQSAAEKSCECLKKLTVLNDENYQNCISTSLTESLMVGDVKGNMKKIGTVKGMKLTLEKVYTMIENNCVLDPSNEIDQKKEIFYGSSPNHEANISYNIGKDFMEQGNYEWAVKSFEKALEHDQLFVIAYDDLGLSHRRLDHFDEAISYYKKSLAIFPEGDFALMNIAAVYNLQEKYATSNEYYAKLIQYQPQNPEGYYGFGRNLSFLGDYENALRYMIKAHKIYGREKSDYEAHSLQMIKVIYSQMKEKGSEKDFLRIAKENGLDIKQKHKKINFKIKYVEE